MNRIREAIPSMVAFAALAGVALLWYERQPTEGEPSVNTKHYERLLETVAGLQGRVYRERIVNLPEDGHQWHTVFVLDDRNSQVSRYLLAMFATDPQLRSLVAQTKTHEYTPNDRMYRARYAKAMGGEMPQFWLIRDDGKACYKVSGARIPTDPTVMARDIQEMIARCPRPSPGPNPTPTPTPVQPVPPSIPDITPVVDPPTPDDQGGGLMTKLIIALAAVAGGALGITQERRESD